MFLIYDLLFIFFAILYFPYVIIRRKWHNGFWARLGFFSRELQARLGSGGKVWIHAVSVGEVIAVAGIFAKIRERYPQHGMVVTVVTQTGYRVAQSKFGTEAVVIYAPLDFSFIVRKYIRIIRPRVYISAETEIWPNIFYALLCRNIPIVLVNGRISDGSFRGYRLFRFLFAPLLRQGSAFCVQSAVDAQRLIILGARPGSVFVCGNFKFDEMPAAPPENMPRLKFPAGQPVWIAGSTHPGEELIVLRVFKKLREEFENLRLVIAPRHAERFAVIKTLVEKEGLCALPFSRGVDSADPRAVVILDTTGHLRYLYADADIVFIGKSLTGQGGQNILEPAYFSKAIITGPRTENFRKINEIFRAGNGLAVVNDQNELFEQMRMLLRDPARRRKMGDNAKALLERNKGAVQKAFEIVSTYIPA